MPPAKQQSSLQAFLTCSLLDRQVIVFYQLLKKWYGASTAEINRCIVEARLRSSQEQRLTRKSCAALLQRLKAGGWLGNVSSQRLHDYFCGFAPEELRYIISGLARCYPREFMLSENSVYFFEEFDDIYPMVAMAVYGNHADLFLSFGLRFRSSMNFFAALTVMGAEISFSEAWLSTRHPMIQLCLCLAKFACYYRDTPVPADLLMVLRFYQKTDFSTVKNSFTLYHQSLFALCQGDMDAAMQYFALMDSSSSLTLTLSANFQFLKGDINTAVKTYKKALKTARKVTKSQCYYFDDISLVFYQLALLYGIKAEEESARGSQQYVKFVEYVDIPHCDMTMQLMDAARHLLQQDKDVAHHVVGDIRSYCTLNMSEQQSFMLESQLCLMEYLLGQDNSSSDFIARLKKNIARFTTCQYGLGQLLLLEIFTKLVPEDRGAQAALARLPIKFRWLKLVFMKKQWEYGLEALSEILVEPEKDSQALRTLWLLNPDDYELTLCEQKRLKSGKWGKGRKIPASKLVEYSENARYLSLKDKQALSALERLHYWSREYEFNMAKALPALIGHDNIEHSLTRTKLSLQAMEIELFIEEESGGYRFSLSHSISGEGVVLEALDIHHYNVLKVTPELSKIARVLSEKGLWVPEDGKEQIIALIKRANSDISIHTSSFDVALPKVDANPAPYLQLYPQKQGARIAVWVKPLPESAYFPTAQGKNTIMASRQTAEGKTEKVRAVRDFAAEKQHFQDLMTACPTLLQSEVAETGHYEMPEVETVLEVLSELEAVKETQALQIEWPQGQPFRIKHRLNSQSLSLSITSKTNWFEYEGDVALDDAEVMGLQVLLDAMDKQSTRFIQLSDGDFLELSTELRRQLDTLRAMSDGHKVHALGAGALSDLTEQVEHVVFDKGWQAHLDKLEAMEKHEPAIPSTLQANLRDYQQDGFYHLSKLTHWGMGACLADEMGLGKTLQTICLLLERAPKGPALVIAPTSVCFNWHAEIQRFAPTLNLKVLEINGREDLITGLGPFDVLVCSYGLLNRNVELLEKVAWESLVVDEAQAIKNPTTKRWKALMRLKGHNRIALTGTPIENHLGELWSIFSFINPGMFGSVGHFQQKYIVPIENQESKPALQALRTLVKPYILRRLKSQVLEALPPKTEQTLFIEPTEEERAFYEALRKNALEQLDEGESKNRINILAQIGRLRQACCDSSLVNDDLTIPNSKLKNLERLLQDIIENGHKVLLFSQYVRFLQKVKERLEALNISFQYLDGSTSAVQRKKAVDAFQNGEGDVFLLSLKAGGSGLNLTAADYVIHLDPWWNPAVEDQASDRAHRIGQQRPVTVYRLIMKDTIEEKILKLHADKRHLAEELLAEQGISGKLSDEALLALLQGRG